MFVCMSVYRWWWNEINRKTCVESYCIHTSENPLIHSNKFIECLAHSKQCAQLRGTLHICLYEISISVTMIALGEDKRPKRLGQN